MKSAIPRPTGRKRHKIGDGELCVFCGVRRTYRWIAGGRKVAVYRAPDLPGVAESWCIGRDSRLAGRTR